MISLSNSVDNKSKLLYNTHLLDIVEHLEGVQQYLEFGNTDGWQVQQSVSQ